MRLLRQFSLFASALVSALTLVACDGGGTTASLTSIAANTASSSLYVAGPSTQVTVTGYYSDGRTSDLTSQSTFVSSNTSVVTVDATGKVSPVAQGTAVITATNAGSGKTAATGLITVGPTPPPALQSLAVTAAASSLVVGGATTQLTVTGTYDRGPTQDLTSTATYVANTAGVVSVSAAGVVTAVAAGTTTITATVSGISGTSGTITVTVPPPPVLQSIAVAPGATALVVGGATTQLTVTGTYNTGPTQDLTAGSTFHANTAGVVSISASGVVTPVAAGSTTITATHTASGKTATTPVITVTTTAPVLQSIAATVGSGTLNIGATTQVTVTGTYNTGPTQDLTSASTFVSDKPGVASVNSSGLITAAGIGTAHITATHTASGKTAQVTVTVSAGANSGYVFFNDYVPGVAFVPFGGSTNALSVDTTTTNNGRASLKIIVPGSNYTGGALVNGVAQNLTAFNAVTFWAKASAANNLNVIGIGNDAVGGATYSAEINATPLTTTWTKYTIPLPDPSRPTAVTGMFHFAEGGKGYTIWLNDIQYVNLGAGSVVPTVAAVTAGWAPQTLAPGATSTIGNSTVPFSAPAIAGNVETNVGPGWLTLASSNTSIATVNALGVVTGVAVGNANITGKLIGTSVPGQEAVTVAVPQLPANSPPTPAVVGAVAVYSPHYSATSVLDYNAGFCGAIPNPPTYAISGGDTVLTYPLTHTVVCGAWAAADVGGGSGSHVNATGKTILHVDVWTPNPPPVLDIQIVDFTGSTVASDFYVTYGTGLAAGCTASNWCSLEIPLNTGTVPALTPSSIGQVLIVGQDTPGGGFTGPSTVFIDNFYFH